jgi:polyisoprenyl-teichoic acid--peptidoglycan teichoic acid transferase
MSNATTPPTQRELPPGAAAPQPPPRRKWMLRRFALGAAGVIALAAAVTATFALNEVDKIVEALGQTRAARIGPDVLAPTVRGAPETLLLVGDDRRPPPRGNPLGSVPPHSNEMLLVRVDPSKPTVSMLSIPRELRVTIHPRGGAPVVNRINSAYTFGGIQLMTETIKQVLGVAVNHVFVVTFPKFKRAVNEIGCVYGTIDRRYYHVNEPGGEQYFQINLQPGYQRLCGRQALEFVANRHEDTSLTRDARDQRFLLEVKNEYGASLFEQREEFERVLGRAVETDLHGSSQVLDLLELLAGAQGKPVRQVRFHVTLQPTYDTATRAQIHEAVRSFLSGTAATHQQSLSGSSHAAAAHRRGRRAPSRSGSSGLGLSSTPGTSITRARTLAPQLPFPLEYPREAVTYPAAASELLRRYDVRDPRGRLQPIYDIAVNSGPLGEYYDVQGTTWTDPPLLTNPGQTLRTGSRTYSIFYTGEQVRVIAWREGNAAYWVQNTLTNSLSPRQMLAIAASTRPVLGGFPAGASAHAIAATAAASVLRPQTQTATGPATKVGAVLAFVSLLALAALAWVVLARERELRTLRRQVAAAIELEARQRPMLTSAALAPEPAGPAPEPALLTPGPRPLAQAGAASAHDDR